jgi:hypothetical protein
MITKNEIKKILYKQNPKANFSYIRKEIAYYKAIISIEKTEEKLPETYQVLFEIPVKDMGDADFFQEMDGKLLIRWISINE